MQNIRTNDSKPTDRLAGRGAIITGGGSGIGRATARQLASEGAAVAIVDKRADAADEVAAEVDSAGGSALAFSGDVGDEEFIQDVVAQAEARFPRVDTVVAAAGITIYSATDAMTLETWESTLRVNLTGVFLTLKHALPRLVSSGDGVIVTLGSVASLVAAGGSAAYDASKGGVLQLTRAVAVEYAEQGVRANCVCPSLVHTNIAANSEAVSGLRSDRGRIPAASRIRRPMSRGAEPEEIARVIAFLCSPESAFITGTAIPVDGGHTAI